MQMCDTVLSVMSHGHEFKGRTGDEAFQEQFFLWETGGSVSVDLFNVQEHKQDSQGKGEIRKKHNRST